MSHKTVTHELPTPMPRITYLMRRGGRYCLNMRIPKDLWDHIGRKPIRYSLGTSDWNEAKKILHHEVGKQLEFFELERRKIIPSENPVPAKKRQEISEREMHTLVYRFFIQLEKNSESWWEERGRKLGEEELAGVLDTLSIDEEVYRGGSPHYREAEGDSKGELPLILEKEGLALEEESPSYKKLLALFRRARLENVRRSMDRVSRHSVKARESFLQKIFAHTPIPEKEDEKETMTLGGLLAHYKKLLAAENTTAGTKKTYIVPERVLSEVIGNDTPLKSIQGEDIDRLLSILRRAPSNAAKKYPKLTLEQAILAADKEGNKNILKRPTLENYLVNLSAIFNVAAEKDWISKNPFKARRLRKAFLGADEENKKAHFSSEELNRLFRAPLYVGCKNDGIGFAKIGPNRPRRGRFWVPLLSLFLGCRLNEAAQLYTEDVIDEEKIPYLLIRDTRADGSKCDKRLKTEQSRRRIPIHPELVKIGFLTFVASRSADVDCPRLFPELPNSKTGYFSDKFSKWFGRFKTGVLGDGCKATFHSFRHGFRTALGEAGVPIGDVEMLGGWDSGGRSSEKLYDSPSLVRHSSYIQQIEYPGLDLTHLYAQQSQNEH